LLLKKKIYSRDVPSFSSISTDCLYTTFIYVLRMSFRLGDETERAIVKVNFAICDGMMDILKVIEILTTPAFVP